MRCYICGKYIIIKRTIKTLFHFKPIFRCNSCKRKHQIFLNKQVIPKENGLFYISSLFLDDNDFDWLAFNDEVSSWFIDVLKNKTEEDLVLWLDDLNIEILENLDKSGKDIYILIKKVLVL